MNLNNYTLNRIMKMLIVLVIIIFAVFHLEEIAGWMSKLFVLLTPFFIGGAMAFVLNAPLRLFERRLFKYIKVKWFKKIQRFVGILLSLILIVLSITLIGVIIVPQLIDSISLFAGNTPKYMHSIEQVLLRVSEQVPDMQSHVNETLGYLHSLTPEKIQEQILSFVQSGIVVGDKNIQSEQFISGALTSTFGIVTTVFGKLINIVIGFVFAICILITKEKLAVQGRRIIFAFCAPDYARYLIHVFQVAFAKFYSFITGQLTEAVILGSLMTLGMFLLKLPYALMIGVLVGFSALIPIAGALIGGAVGFLLVASVSITKALIFLVFLIILQQIEGHVIYPFVVGGSVGLPSMWTIAAITIGGSLMGLVGMIVIVPVAATLYTLFAEIVYGRLQVKNISMNDPHVLYGVPDDKRLPR